MRNSSRRTIRWAAAAIAAAGLLGTAGAVQAELQARDLTGDSVADAYYDTVLNITWLQDANYARTSGFDADGLMRWSAANSWAAGLSFGGYDDWRLARMSTNPTLGLTESPVNCSVVSASACAAGGSELGYMYYFNLGPGQVKTGTQTSGDATFINIHFAYWSATERVNDGTVPGGQAMTFYFDGHFPRGIPEPKDFVDRGAWAVRDGDVTSAVPEPETYAMLFAGLGMLGFAARRRRRKEASA